MTPEIQLLLKRLNEELNAYLAPAWSLLKDPNFRKEHPDDAAHLFEVIQPVGSAFKQAQENLTPETLVGLADVLKKEANFVQHPPAGKFTGLDFAQATSALSQAGKTFSQLQHMAVPAQAAPSKKPSTKASG